MTSWNSFIESVKDAESDLGNPHEIWYRGQSVSSWNLTPSLLRETEWVKKEKELFVEFKRTASRLFEKRNNDWEVLFDMQHYWIPTRLLDWTSVLGVAIAFIMYGDYHESEDSALYILDPSELNKLSGRYEIINVPEEKAFDYKDIFWEHKPVCIEKPIAIRPSFQSDRIAAQKGVFTVHGDNVNGFEEFAALCFRKVIMNSEAKEEANLFLKWANLDEYTIYPDIVGMARHIRRKILG